MCTQDADIWEINFTIHKHSYIRGVVIHCTFDKCCHFLRLVWPVFPFCSKKQLQYCIRWRLLRFIISTPVSWLILCTEKYHTYSLQLLYKKRHWKKENVQPQLEWKRPLCKCVDVFKCFIRKREMRIKGAQFVVSSSDQARATEWLVNQTF